MVSTITLESTPAARLRAFGKISGPEGPGQPA